MYKYYVFALLCLHVVSGRETLDFAKEDHVAGKIVKHSRYVRFYNGSGRYLCSSEDKFGDWKKERRELDTCTEKNVRTIWDLQKMNDNEYTIRNTLYNEYLFDSNHNGRQSVYTWAPGGTVSQGFWQLKSGGGDFFYLMNESNDDRERRYLNGPEHLYTSVERLQKWRIIEVPNR